MFLGYVQSWDMNIVHERRNLTGYEDPLRPSLAVGWWSLWKGIILSKPAKKTWHNIDQHVFLGLSKKNIDWMAIVTLFVDVFSPVLQSDSEVMLYEMLVGSRPFRGTNNIFVLYCRFGKQWAVFKTPVGWWFVWGLYYPMYWIPFLTNQFAFYIN